MKKQRNIVRSFIRTIALASLLSTVALVTTSPARAQTAAASWTFTGSLKADRFGHTSTLLPNGKVLVVGGGGFPCSGSYCYSTVNGSAELYDPATGTWSLTGHLVQRRSTHSATLLPNGQVLVVGGYNYGYDIGFFAYVNSAELYDPTTGSWRVTASPNSAYIANSATLLKSGKVLAVFVKNPSSQGISAELYDPATATWTSTAAPTNLGIMRPLPNGKLLSVSSNSPELYDPATGSWTRTGGFNVIRAVSTATILNNGKVLVTGDDGSGKTIYAELFDPTSGAWSRTGSLNTSAVGTATLLLNGNVLVAGGETCSDVECHSLDGAELYDQITGTWRLTSHLGTTRSGHSATLLPNGKVLVAGGMEGDIYDFPKVLTSAELYEPSTGSAVNPIDDAQSFIRQHYRDFLNRNPDPDGLAFWTNEITSCGVDPQCVELKRINDSASFFLSIEFQETGYLVYRFYKTSYGNLPNAPVPIRLNEFLPDTQKIGQDVIVRQSGWEQKLESNKQAFATEFVQRSRFVSAYPTSMSAEQFVDRLFANAEVTPSATDRAAAINEFSFGATTADVAARARALRRVAENSTLAQQEFNRAFVLMQYFGYLRRDPDSTPDTDLSGYYFWLNKLNAFKGDYANAEMVKAFINSSEYRNRF